MLVVFYVGALEKIASMKVRNQYFLVALGKRIRQIRKEKKLTQSQLAEKIDNHDEQIGRIERAEVNVSASMLFLIAKGLEVPLKEIFDFQFEEQ